MRPLVHATPPARRLRLYRGLRLKLRNGCLAAVRLAGGHTLRARSTARRARIRCYFGTTSRRTPMMRRAARRL